MKPAMFFSITNFVCSIRTNQNIPRCNENTRALCSDTYIVANVLTASTYRMAYMDGVRT